MARVGADTSSTVVVVGAGIAGMAAAARLAKLGHRVVVFERSERAGGACHLLEQAGFYWEASPGGIMLPAVLRDLFRKSGRPLDYYLELRMRPVARRHVFADGAIVDLPTGSRGAQIHAVDEGLGAPAGRDWAIFVDGQAPVWERLRHDVLDRPDGSLHLSDRAVSRAVGANTTLAKVLSAALADPRLAAMAAGRVDVYATRSWPGQLSVAAYVERTFGLWEAPGGLASVVDALVARLGERKVDLRLGQAVEQVIVHAGAATGVVLADGSTMRADAVVAAVDPRTVFTSMLDPTVAGPARRILAGAQPVRPPSIVHLGLQGPRPGALGGADVPEVILHGEPQLTLTPGRSSDSHRWTLTIRYDSERTADDVVDVLAARGVDVRHQVVTRVDRTPDDIIRESGSAPYGLAWDGLRSHARRSAAARSVARLHIVGAAGHPGLTLPGGDLTTAAWSAAHLAELIQP